MDLELQNGAVVSLGQGWICLPHCPGTATESLDQTPKYYRTKDDQECKHIV